MKYYVVGILQHTASDEWVHVNKVMDTRYWEDAAVEAGNEALVEDGQTDGPYTDVEKFGDWNYWLMMVVALDPSLHIAYEGNETFMPGVDEALKYTPDTASPRRAVAAFDTDGGNTLVLRLLVGQDLKQDALRAARKLMDPEKIHGIYGAVVERPDGILMAMDTEGELVEADRPATSVKVPTRDLDVISRHRQSLGMGPLDPAAGWTKKELHEMAERIRKTGRMNNPAKLKRRLMP